RTISFSVNLANDSGVRAMRNNRSDAAAVTASRVWADSIVATSTSKGSFRLSCEIFSTAGAARSPTARASARITAWMVREDGFRFVALVSATICANFFFKGGTDETFACCAVRTGAVLRTARPSCPGQDQNDEQ